MQIVKAIITGIGVIVFEGILCLGRVISYVLQRVAASFALLFLLSAVLAMIKNGLLTYMVGASVLGFVLCFLIPFLLRFLLTGAELLEERLFL